MDNRHNNLVRYQRAELHNHTTQSDGRLTVKELMEYAAKKQFGVIALTDHNTCSGHEIAEQIIREEELPLALLKGVEATTYYGHVLALGTSTPVDLLGLNPQAPEEFFDRLRRDGAAAIGLAHPFCIGRPVMAGCRFDMEVHNWNLLDYIEVFNTSGGADKRSEQIMGNEQALKLWEELVLGGYHLAAVSGKDIHGYPAELPCMITYALLPEKPQQEENLATEVLSAILTQRTLVTRGPLFDTEVENGKLVLHFDQSFDYLEWNRRYRECCPVLWVKDNSGAETEYRLDWSEHRSEIPLPEGAETIVLRLYDGECLFERMLAAGVCVRLEGAMRT